MFKFWRSSKSAILKRIVMYIKILILINLKLNHHFLQQGLLCLQFLRVLSTRQLAWYSWLFFAVFLLMFCSSVGIVYCLFIVEASVFPFYLWLSKHHFLPWLSKLTMLLYPQYALPCIGPCIIEAHFWLRQSFCW